MKTNLMADNKGLLILLMLAAACILPGCGFMGIGKSDFDCPGGAEGVRCMSARQVYQATESSDYVKTKAEKSEDNKKNNGTPVHFEQDRVSQVAVPRIDQPVPIRTQAKVMRIWMTPWEDQDGDLHADGFMYTEIESRRWNLGDRFTSPSTAISPLSVATPSKVGK